MILLLASITVNFAVGHGMLRCLSSGRLDLAKRILILAIVADLGALGYPKYANFFVDSINSALHTNINLARIVLPIGISFFTFTQIAFLVDTFRGKVQQSRIIPYTLFVTFSRI